LFPPQHPQGTNKTKQKQATHQLTVTTQLTKKFAHTMASKAVTKVAVVIGYGAGVGHAVAAKWASNGYAVALVSRSAAKLEAAVKTVPNSKAYSCDASDPAAVTAMLIKVEAEMGSVNALLYNAGNGVWKKFDEATVEEMDTAMKINVYGLMAACQEVCPKMAAVGGGFVCVTGATASLRGMPFTSVFAAAKAAQKSLCMSIARQVWADKVHMVLNIIDAKVGTGEGKMSPESIANEYWHLSEQNYDCWTFQHHIQCHTSDMGIL
jgi:short-subunit dehydrogenase